ncbi:iron complex transport system substrate-binding protein [Melghiribacillus thermohalophilus]|uniref:Iron complex transport system substrate-binding protein n=1 Tax=Melghiribacillus thermohalophilus TaxID=1324956 RepID=A0A4R3N5N5_9BACI|nr:cobalamin-binding protein [Melghiribacillus thermohalophilus]TCT23621.1 iron complex transport system substrate-binding protein [Melghiribacillus thermohalophilus]
MRLVSICPSNTEMLAYLGLTEFLTGVDDFSDWPEQVRNLPRLGPDLNIRMDEVEKLQPDLVLASLSVPGMEKNIEELKKRNIPHIVLNPQSLEDIAQDLLTIGKHTGYEKMANQLYEQYMATLERYHTINQTIAHKPSLYWEWWPKPVFTPGNTNWLTEVSELAGGQNSFATEETANVQTTWDEVLSRDPDYICMVWVGVKTEKMRPELVIKRPGWGDMKAVRRNQIFVLEESLYCRPSPRVLQGLNKLASLLHPGKYPPYNGTDPLLGK